MAVYVLCGIDIQDFHRGRPGDIYHAFVSEEEALANWTSYIGCYVANFIECYIDMVEDESINIPDSEEEYIDYWESLPNEDVKNEITGYSFAGVSTFGEVYKNHLHMSYMFFLNRTSIGTVGSKTKSPY